MGILVLGECLLCCAVVNWQTNLFVCLPVTQTRRRLNYWFMASLFDFTTKKSSMASHCRQDVRYHLVLGIHYIDHDVIINYSRDKHEENAQSEKDKSQS